MLPAGDIVNNVKVSPIKVCIPVLAQPLVSFLVQGGSTVQFVIHAISQHSNCVPRSNTLNQAASSTYGSLRLSAVHVIT
jgi:hypothetical protein